MQSSNNKYLKADWTSFKQHVEHLISNRSHTTNVHEANKHLIKAILDASFSARLFIPKKNQNITNHTHLPMHICMLIHHHNHIRKQNRSDPKITILNNHIPCLLDYKTGIFPRDFELELGGLSYRRGLQR